MSGRPTTRVFAIMGSGPMPLCWAAHCSACRWLQQGYLSRSSASSALTVHIETPSHLTNWYEGLR